MTAIVLQDALRVPKAFRWNGPVPGPTLDAWLAGTGFAIPGELLEVWRATGGGELFESETLFEPSSDGEDDIDDANEQLLALGLPLDHLVFHRGTCITAIERLTGDIIELRLGTFREVRRYSSFNEWYVTALRTEYASRYGLDQPS